MDARDPVGYGSAMAWTPADRSAMAVPGFPSQAGKQSYNAAISRQDRGAILGADSGIGDGDFRWTASQVGDGHEQDDVSQKAEPGLPGGN